MTSSEPAACPNRARPYESAHDDGAKSDVDAAIALSATKSARDWTHPCSALIARRVRARMLGRRPCVTPNIAPERRR
jgi:hypothetical protein